MAAQTLTSTKPTKFPATRLQLSGETTITVDVFSADQARYYVTVTLRQLRSGDTWQTARSVTLNPSELAWFTAGAHPPNGAFGRVQATKDRKDATTLARIDEWSRPSSTSAKAKERKVLLTPSLYSSLKEKLSTLNDAVTRAEEHVAACKTEQYRSDRATLADLVVGIAVRISNQLRQQTCAGCLDNVDVSNQEAHVCMTEQYVLCERALDGVTIDQLASVLASNGLGRPTITVQQIVGDDRDRMIQCVVQQVTTPVARSYMDRHADVQQLLFQVHPTPSTWNTASPDA